MFRSRFLLTAAVAVATALLAPAVGQAGFSVTFSSTNIGDVWVVNDQNSPANTGDFFDDTATPLGANLITTGTFNNGEDVLFNGLQVDVITETNNPGTASLGTVFTTQIRIENEGATSKNLRIVIESTNFAAPGADGEKLFLQTVLTNLMQSELTLNDAPGNDVVKSEVDGPGESAATDPNSFALAQSGQWFSNRVIFTRGANYNLRVILDLNIAAGETVNFDVESQVTPTPAPAGLVMLASALPFVGFGLIRRRLRKSEPVTAA